MKYIYVDNSNFFIGGGNIAVVKKGLARDETQVTKEQWHQVKWQVNYSELYRLLSDGDAATGCAKLWGSEPPNAPFWSMVKQAGFEAEHWERNSVNKEKGIDTAIALEIGMDSGDMDKSTDEIIIVSGDEDIIKSAEKLRKKGFKVTIYAWAYNVARKLKSDGLNFIDLTPHFAALTL